MNWAESQMAEEVVNLNNRGFRTNEAEEVYLGKENTIDRGLVTAYSTSGKKHARNEFNRATVVGCQSESQ